MRKLLLPATMTAASLLLGFVVNVSAQSPDSRNPPMASLRLDNSREDLYAIFSQNKQGVSPEQQRLAYVAAKNFLQRYGGEVDDIYVKEARQFVKDYDRVVSQYEVFAAFNGKKYLKAFELGRPLLAADRENFFTLGVLAEAGYENSLAKNTTLDEETIDYLRRAIQLLEGGKVSKPDPFKSRDAASGFLNLALGSLVKDKSPVEAATAFTKAVQPKSPYANDPLTYYRLGVAILKGPYAQRSTEYNEKYGSQRSSAEQQAALVELNTLTTRALDAYARAVALSDPARPAPAAPATQFTPDFRSKVLAQLTALYKSLHNDSDTGLTDLISDVLSKPLP